MLFSTLFIDRTIALGLDKLSLPLTPGWCDTVCKTAHHLVVAKRRMAVTTVIANKKLVFDAGINYLPKTLHAKALCRRNLLYFPNLLVNQDK